MGCEAKYYDVPEFYHSLLDEALVKADTNAAEILAALAKSPLEQKEGMAFLISYMPKKDLTTLKASFLLENAEYAYKARARYSWCKSLPDSIFFNEVLPYSNVAETRDPWRKDFFERFSKYVDGKENLKDAIFAIAKPINKEVNVEYNINRSIVDSSPKEAMAENMATCTGLSIILTDAFRSVGIPSRLAGTAMWTNMRGNHTWSEVWIDNQWKFIEYYPEDLNESWFLKDAGKADPTNPLHWIYAVSYKPTGQYYYAGKAVKYLYNELEDNQVPEDFRDRLEEWQQSSKNETTTDDGPYIHGVNVTQRYIDLYNESFKNEALSGDEIMVEVVVFKDNNTDKSDSRIACRIDVLQNDETVDFGYSPRATDDMNKFLSFKLLKNTDYKIVVSNSKHNLKKTFDILTKDADSQGLKLILYE